MAVSAAMAPRGAATLALPAMGVRLPRCRGRLPATERAGPSPRCVGLGAAYAGARASVREGRRSAVGASRAARPGAGEGGGADAAAAGDKEGEETQRSTGSALGLEGRLAADLRPRAAKQEEVPAVLATASSGGTDAAVVVAGEDATGADVEGTEFGEKDERRFLRVLVAVLYLYKRAFRRTFGWAIRPVRRALPTRYNRLRRLRAAANANPGDPHRVAAYFAGLNAAGKHDDVVLQFERSKNATGEGCVREYMTALSASGKMPDADLPALLEKLKGRAQAAPGDGEPVTRSLPGSSMLVPLHISLVEDRRRGGAFATLSRLAEVLAFSILLLAVFWIGAAVVVVQKGGGVDKSAGSGLSGGAGSGLQSPSAFLPKEYGKDGVEPDKGKKKTFADVKGVDEAVNELADIVEYLKNPDKFTRLGGQLPRGVLLVGPPGTGKTLLARAIAGEAGVPFYYRAGPEFEEMFVGVGSRRVRELFKAAKKKAPCIVFIDEIDAVGGSRNSLESKKTSGRQTLNQLLVEMDGFEPNEGIVVLAATNMPETLDKALTRPGRFDQTVAVPNPDVRGRTQILEHYLANKPVAKDVNIDVLARGTSGFSGADLFNLVNVAAVKGSMEGHMEIGRAVLDFAKDKILMGVERKSAVISPENMRLTAYHEAGHALVATLTDGALPVHKATITPRGNTLGMVTQLPDRDDTSINLKQMLARLDVCMGGRVAEELIFGAEFVTTGATGDLKQATALARHMVAECGMSDSVGPVFHAVGAEYGGPSSETGRLIEEEVKRLLTESYARVTSLLSGNKDLLHRLAGSLLEHETMTAEQIRDVIGNEGRVPGRGYGHPEVDDPQLVPVGSFAKDVRNSR